MAPLPFAPAADRLGARRPAAQREGKAVLLVLAVLGAPALWHCGFAGLGFVAGRQASFLPGRGQSPTQRRAGYSFKMERSDDHTNLRFVKKEEGTVRVSTSGSFLQGNYNTVLGDTPIPASGRSYWEVKVVKKPSDAWEYIGVAEPNADVTVPLTRNRKGAGWFWGSTHTESFMYTFLATRPEFVDAVAKKREAFIKTIIEDFGYSEKDANDDPRNEAANNMWKGVPGTHVGMIADKHPPFADGMVVGVDVDMDAGTLAYWVDGKFLGVATDTEGKPISLKGKKVVPALSVYGRKTSRGFQNTFMEVTTGLEPPPKP
mmetsp:Transcript_71418/g.159918  ORF Transcript_71418/g.159918 Transcript_71418/m.159918 type:complete len:317 (-) Transcript_71418:46-996(-)